MAVTDYLQKSSGTCRYSYNKLKSVLYLVSEEHIKDVIIDNGEAYISGLTELPLRINGFNIQFNEETSLDERYKFQKTLTLSMHGYVNYKIFGGRYYAIVESMDGTFYMINVDFPSRITHTFNLSKDTNQTDFTFASLSNFPTLKLNAEFEAVEPVCLGLRVHGIDTLELLEREKAVLDTENKRVISTEDFKKVEFLGDSCTFQEVYDGFKVTDTITFDIALDNYKPSWQYNLLEFLDNRYASIITPKGGDNKYYPGFNFGLQPNYTIQTASQNGQSDIITVTLVEMSSYGTTAANDWSDDQDTETRWRWVKKVNEIICYECIGLGKARYLVKQEVDAFGVPTGDYQVMEGYESQYPVFHIVGTFTEQQIFDTNDCGDESSCTITSDIPATVVFTSTTCNSYSLRTTCDWQITDIPSHITVSPTSGFANTDYTISVCNTLTPSATPVERNLSLKCCRNVRLINTKVMLGSTCLKPAIKQINCLAQTITFAYNGSCQIQVLYSGGLTYQVGFNTLTVQVPANTSTSAITWTLTYKNCECSADEGAVIINQDKQYERWVEESGYICDSGNSYHIEVKYTGTTSSDINTRTSQTRKGSLIQSGDTRCGSETKYEWDGKYYCIDGDKYKALEEFALINGTWVKTGRTMLGEMVESDSTWCESEVSYSWSSTTQTECSGTTSYYKYQKYIKIGEQDWLPDYPNVWSIDGNGTMPLNKKQDNDPNCGYVPEPMYDWEDMNISTNYYCLDCGSDAPKLSGNLSGDTTFSINCNSSSTLTSGETIQYSGMTYAKIGSCVTSIGQMAFAGKAGLSGVTMPSTITTIGPMAFNGSGALVDCILPDSVTTIGNGAFGNCVSLTNFVLWDSVTTIGVSAFTNCDSLISINIPTGLTSIPDYCFTSCGALSEVTIPSGVTSIGDRAFSGCTGLMSITCLAETPPTLGLWPFDNTNNCPIFVPEPYVNDYKMAWYDYANRIQSKFFGKFKATYSGGTSYSVDCDSATTLTTATTRAGGDMSAMTTAIVGNCVTSLSNNVFSGATGLTSIEIPSTITSIGSYAFYNCKSLTTNIQIPSNATSIGNYTFYNCSGLTSMEIPNSVTSIGSNAFNGCANLTSIDIPDNVMSIGSSAFRNCTGLTGITINAVWPPQMSNNWSSYPFYNTTCPIYVPCQSVDVYKQALNYTPAYSRIEAIPNSCFSGKFKATYSGGTTYSADCDSNATLTTATTRAGGDMSAITSVYIGDCVTSIGNYAFSGCNNISEVIIPSGVTSIGYEAFNDCSNLRNIYWNPNRLREIRDYAFVYCQNLVSISDMDYVETIGRYAFAGCSNLSSNIKLAAIRSIGSGAFADCRYLRYITIYNQIPPTLDSTAFMNCSRLSAIYVPAESVDTYKNASGWSEYASLITAIQ